MIAKIKLFDDNKNRDMVILSDKNGLVFGMVHVDFFHYDKDLSSRINQEDMEIYINPKG